MPLPLLPGLMAPETDDPSTVEPDSGSAPSDLAAFIDSLDDAQMQELVGAAQDYADANPDDPSTEQPGAEEDGPVDPDAAPADDDDPDAPAADDDPDAPPADDDGSDANSQGLDAIDSQLDSDIESAATVIKQMQGLADGDSDSAPDVAKLVKQATALNDKMAKQRKLLDKAMKADDVQAAGQAGMDANDTLTAMQKLLEAAQALGVKTEAPPMKASDHPTMKAWAAKVQGKKLPPASPGA